MSESFEDINVAKVNLDHIYNQQEPRAYFRELRKLGYAIPGSAKPVFQTLIRHLRNGGADPIRLLDLGCSYGVNAALLKHDMTMGDLYAHWGDEALDGADPEQVMAEDKRFFDGLDTVEDLTVLGLDRAENAVAFAEEAGLLDTGLALNLESEPLPATAEAELAGVDLVTSTGCVGYVTEKSFEKLMPVISEGRRPWMGNFVLRLFPFDQIESALAEWGYVTEKLEGHTFVQRRFASEAERDGMLKELSERGIDPAGKEAEGSLHAELYLSRPAEDARKAPLSTLFDA